MQFRRLRRIFACLLVVMGPTALRADSAPKRVPVKSAPPAPKRADVPIDAGLRAAATKEIEAGLASSDELTRCHAIEAARKGLGPAGGGLIVRALRDPSPLVRFAALMAAGDMKLEPARSPAFALLNDDSPNVRVAARFALHRLGDTRFSHDLEGTLADPDVRVRRNSVLALGLLGEPSAVPLLKARQRDADAGVRLQVAEALWRLGSEDGLATLVAGTISAYADDQMICLPALAATHDGRVVQHLRPGLTADQPEVRLAAARALGDLGLDEGLGVALQGARSKDPRQRQLAALAMGVIGRADSQEPLAALLREKDSKESADVRLAAAIAILQLKEGKG